MANQLREFIQNIVNAIGNKKQIPGGFINAQDIPSEIESIEPPYDTINITANGEVNVTDYKKASVVVSDDNFQILQQILGTNVQWGTTINIPYGITNIGYGKFAENPAKSFNSVKLNIPTSVTTFNQAIIKMQGLSEIYYQGNAEQWININKTMYGTSYYTGSPITEYPEKLKLYINNQLTSENLIDYTTPDNSSIIGNSFAYLYFNELIVKDNITYERGAFGYTNIKKLIWNMSDFNAGYGSTSDSFTFQRSVIKELIINTPITTTGRRSFYYTELETCVFPEGLTTIDYQSFLNANCKYLEFPTTLTTISSEGLRLVNTDCVFVFNCENPPTIQSNSLPNQFTAYVPKGKSATWKTATNWSSKAQYIFERNQVGIQVPSELLNNEQYTYSLDNGETWLQFDSTAITLTEVANIKFKNTNANLTIKIGTSSGASNIGTIANAELNYNTVGDVTIYLTIQ